MQKFWCFYVKNGKLFFKCHESYLFETDKVIQTQENWKILNKTRSIYSKQPNIFFVPKVLRIFFS